MLTNNNAYSKTQATILYRSGIQQLLDRLDEKTFSCTAYDTAWVGQVTEASDGNLSSYPQALEWLREHQHQDGSWGSDIEYFHDRIISTLCAILTLAKAENSASDRERIKRGEHYIRKNIDCLARESIDMVGFELLLPMLFDQANDLNLDLPYAKCEPYRRIRSEKLGMIPPEMLYSRKVSSTHSLEFMGKDLDLDALHNLQEPNGSYGNSPSATAYVLTHTPINEQARGYLDLVLAREKGAAMPAHPVEIFNKSWALYNIELTGIMNEFTDQVKGHLDYLWQCWDVERGVGFAKGYPVQDLDDTAVVFKLLKRAGYPVNPEVFRQFEKETYFTCYTFERTPSIGANVHLLDALGIFHNYEHRARIVKKILNFLRLVRRDNAYWLDKWHISPFYITAHAVIALIGFDNEMARDAVNWILSAQREDGSWGYYQSTAEETAYCLQALITYHNEVDTLNASAIHHAIDYLHKQYGQWDMPSMWIEKCLYTPPHIVESTILSALAMGENL